MTIEITRKTIGGTYEKTVAATGTAEPLKDAAFMVDEVLIVADSTNTQNVYVGFSAAIHKTTLPANPLAASGQIKFGAVQGKRIDLSDVYLDVDINGEGVWVTFLA